MVSTSSASLPIIRCAAETARKRRNVRGEPSAQEGQITGFSREELKKPQIGARWFIVPRTPGWHVRKLFHTLGVGGPTGPTDMLASRHNEQALRQRSPSDRRHSGAAPANAKSWTDCWRTS